MMKLSDNKTEKKHKCPQCGKLTKYDGNPYRPFCSKRCKMVDLGAWLREEYSISSPLYSMDESVPDDK